MKKLLFVGTDLRVSGDVTFFPHATDPKKNKAIIPVINNRDYKDGSGNDIKDTLSLHVWGKYADVACYRLYTGKQLSVIGEIQTYSKDTGQLTANNKRKLDTDTYVKVDEMKLLGDPMKKLEERFAYNLTRLKAQGRVPEHVIITAADMLERMPSETIKATDFNPAASAATGRHGNARVYSDNKFWDENLSTVQNTYTAPTNDPQASATIAAQAAELEKMKEQMAKLLAAAGNTQEETPVVEESVSSEDAPAEMSAEETEDSLY